jgi:hypothetical protein
MNKNIRDILSRENIHIFAIIVIFAGIPYSRFLMSMGVGLIFTNWAIDPRIGYKLKKAFSDKLVLSFLGIFILHVIGLLWTEDFAYAAKDLRVKLPFFMLPLVFSTTKPLSSEKWRMVFKVFVIVMLSATFRSLYVLYNEGIFNLGSLRNIIKVISHIRFSLYLCIAIFISVYILVFPGKGDRYFKFWAIPVIFWFIIFLLLLKSLTGFVVLGVGLLFLAFYFVHLIRHKVFRLICYMFILGFIMISLSFLIKSYARYQYKIEPSKQTLLEYTENGNKYIHDLKSKGYENGNFVFANICKKELEKEWDKRSNNSYEGKDAKGHQLKYTLIRYLTSKGLNKDSVGISKLTDKDIRAIESGFANYLYTEKFNLYASLYRVFWEFEHYKNKSNPNGLSIVQRLYFMDAGIGIFKMNPVLGVGTGDVKKTFRDYYDKSKVVLSAESRLRSHNQYITMLLTFGVIGFIIVMWGLFYPVLHKLINKQLNFPALIVFGIILLSMLNEDTFETQSGSLLVAFFYSFFIWGVTEKRIPKRKMEII